MPGFADIFMTNTLGQYIQFILSNGNAFFCVCYWLTFLDRHPSNIFEKPMVLYMIVFYACRELYLLEDDNHWELTFAELISASNSSIIFNNIDNVFSVWSICSVLFSCIYSVFQGWKTIEFVCVYSWRINQKYCTSNGTTIN